jgi:predicted DNA-binding ribbon-helix-helix protein
MQKRSLKIAGHGTSVALEPEFWDELERIAQLQDLSMARLVEQIDNERETENLASALRLYVLNALKRDAQT